MKTSLAEDNRGQITMEQIILWLVLIFGMVIAGAIEGATMKTLLSNIYNAGQEIASQSSDQHVRQILTDTWQKNLYLYDYFSTWSPIIFVIIFGGLAILAIYMFIASEYERGDRQGGVI